MPTERLYLSNTYQKNCTSQVKDIRPSPTGIEVVLDRTIFYPTGGGQPHDTGTIAGCVVKDVYEDQATVVHVVESEPSTGSVLCELDWSRRFDHMQQHTGQHILSAVCEQVLDADTIGFHLGSEHTTIDLDIGAITDDDVAKIEAVANHIVFSNLPLSAYHVRAEAISNFPLRKPPQVRGDIRLVEIQKYDYSPCGGTHTSYTGEVGLIKVLRVEKVRQSVRLIFVCGGRALQDFQRKTGIVNQLVETLSAPEPEILTATNRLFEQIKDRSKTVRSLQQQLLDYAAQHLRENASTHNDIHFIRACFDRFDADQIRRLAAKLTEQEDIIVLLASTQGKVHFVFGCSDNVSIHMGQILQQSLATIGGRGGGRPTNAQGGCADASKVDEALAYAYHLVQQKLTRMPTT